jgi:hypothetical protein
VRTRRARIARQDPVKKVAADMATFLINAPQGSEEWKAEYQRIRARQIARGITAEDLIEPNQ